MATVHPSRMGLIPQELRQTNNDRTRGRSPSPRRSRRSPSPRRERSRDRDRGRDGGRRKDAPSDEKRDRRDYSKDGARDRDENGGVEKRRASPQYEDYRRPPPAAAPAESSAPWRQQENMYPGRRDQPRYGGSGYGNGGADFLESRRVQRAAQVVNVWPASPKAPARDLSPKRKKSSKKSKRHRSPSSSDTSSDEEDRRRKERKERKRARRAREKDEKEDKKRRHRSLSHHRSIEEESDDDRRHRSKRSRSRHRSKSKSVRAPSHSRSRSRSPDRMDEERDERLEKPTIPVSSNSVVQHDSMGPPPSGDENDSDDEIGPQPVYKTGGGKKFDERAYGGALLRGEGSAMAAFLQDGTDSRIPRRGEIGLTSDEIAKYEDVGYVMSGSRHRRMNAVRMRKENQVISAEEKRGILKLQRDERERREAILREEFSELVNERLKGGGSSDPRAK
ncbi:ras-induced vulval development antagonist-domain-containing protein [Crassisporium funariophilum]|nr:ras-induced vulval development antagonist-domain-containing protein [Crassisporium funariophilum]